MTQALSSASLVKPIVKKQEGEQDIPTGYGKTESFLLPKDPNWLFLFWEIIPATLELIHSQYNKEILDTARTVIRLHDITGIDSFTGNNSIFHYDMPVILEAKSWYINVPKAGRTYLAELGYLTTDGKFILISRSNSTLLPPGKVSDVIDDKWMIVEGSFQKLLELAGADFIGLGSSERMQIVDQRWKLTEISGINTPSSFSSFSLNLNSIKPENENIWLKADCEIIIYGSASANAIVSINGKDIELQDGKFSIRQALPAGSIVDLPIKARNYNNTQLRQVQIKALREKGK